MTATPKSNTSRILMIAGGGCLALIGTCCLATGALAFMRKSSFEASASAHAELFLAHLQRRDFVAAAGATEYMGGDGLYSIDQFQSCVASTPLGDLTSFECTGVDAEWLMGGDADVRCAIVSASRGPTEVMLGVNSPDSTPYLGFFWFPPGASVGAEWHGDGCARWSGREYFQEPPAGFVRP